MRCKFRKEILETKIGIDSILEFDYMGNSDFEFGALNKSLKRIREQSAHFKYFQFIVGNKQINVFCKLEYFETVVQNINAMAEHKLQLCEFSAFNDYITGGKYFSDKFQCWWDIDNDFFFWIDDDEFTERFKQVILL